LIRKYESILTNITADSIKWSTTEIAYNKNGSIEKLETYRKRRAVKAIITALFMMIATTLIAGGLFLDAAEIPLWQKAVKFAMYLISMAMGVIFDISKNYEKGAFGVPNELDEVNDIWREFDEWKVPQWVMDEVEINSNLNVFKAESGSDGLNENNKEAANEERKSESGENSAHGGTGLQEEPKEVENL
jgi:hypothetical protein